MTYPYKLTDEYQTLDWVYLSELRPIDLKSYKQSIYVPSVVTESAETTSTTTSTTTSAEPEPIEIQSFAISQINFGVAIALIGGILLYATMRIFG